MKVLLIEDRQKRQEQFLNNSNVDLQQYSMLDNVTGNRYQKFKKNILEDQDILKKYDVVISHRSAFDKDNARIMDIMEEYCIKYSKKMILFSGGIFSSYYQTSPFEKLSLNSKILYSQNLKLFLDNIENQNEANLHILAYGEYWEINLLLGVLEKINLLLQKDNDFINELDYDDLNDEVDIELIEDFINIKEDNITKEQISTIRSSIMNYINHKLGLHYVV